MGQPYSLNVINNASTNNFCVFQKAPDNASPNILSLAWFAKQVHGGGAKIKFTWQINYCFVWAETGVLAPGVTFDAGATQNADLSTINKIKFNHAGGAYQFVDQTRGSSEGTLSIASQGDVPMKTASIGVGMSGFGTFAQQAEPNKLFTFTPHPNYWLIAGNFVQGEVMDMGNVTSAVEIKFPANVYSMTATLNDDNTWMV
jgi:rhizosphere induced protein